MGSFNDGQFSRQYLIPPPAESSDPQEAARQMVQAVQRGQHLTLEVKHLFLVSMEGSFALLPSG